MQAGHFYSVRGYDGLRFDPDNVHAECPKCNCFDDMHLISYASNLIERIGEQRYYDLQLRANLYKKDGYRWSRTELEEMIQEYRMKLKKICTVATH
jgi:hypothetical protein